MIRFCTAVSAVAFMGTLPSIQVALFCLLLAFVCVWKKFLRWIFPLWFGLFWGIAFAHWSVNHKLPEVWNSADFYIKGVVVGLPLRSSDYCRFKLELNFFKPTETAINVSKSKTLLAPRKILLNWYKCPKEILPGTEYSMVVRLKRPRGYRNPGGFDRERYLISSGIDAVGYVREMLDVRIPDKKELSVDILRSRVSGFIADGAKTTDRAALLQALLVGDTRAINSQQWILYKNTGTVHLLVISGLHIGLVAGGVYMLLLSIARLFPWVPLKIRIRYAVLGALLLAFGYSLLAGFSLPTQRAWVMVSALMISTLLLRKSSPFSRLWLAATVVLIMDPLAVVSAGFWLSFGAAWMLIYILSGRLGSGLNRDSRLTSLVKIQLAVTLVLTPLLAFHFYHVPISSSLVNLVAVPFVSLLVLPLAMVSLVFSYFFAEIGNLGLNAAGWLLVEGSRWLEVVDQQLTVLWTPKSVSPFAVGAALLGSVTLLMPRAIPGRSLGLVLWLPMLIGYERSIKAPEFSVTVLDVGQGLAIHVETARHHLLYDAGPEFKSGFSAAQAAITPYLLTSGVRRLDKVIVSHGDNDHAGGLGYLRKNWEIGQTMASSDKINGSFSDCRAGGKWSWDGVTFSILHPDQQILSGSRKMSENNRSCVLKIQSKFGSVLLTGDIEREVESELSRHYAEKLQSTVLVVPHHGSQTSSQSAFIKNVQPDIAIVSSGFLNRFGHPHPEILNRYRQHKSMIINTADSGAIRLYFRESAGNGTKPTVSRYRYAHKRYWWD